jgi:hypothetical protein
MIELAAAAAAAAAGRPAPPRLAGALAAAASAMATPTRAPRIAAAADGAAFSTVAAAPPGLAGLLQRALPHSAAAAASGRAGGGLDAAALARAYAAAPPEARAAFLSALASGPFGFEPAPIGAAAAEWRRAADAAGGGGGAARLLAAERLRAAARPVAVRAVLEPLLDAEAGGCPGGWVCMARGRSSSGKRAAGRRVAHGMRGRTHAAPPPPCPTPGIPALVQMRADLLPLLHRRRAAAPGGGGGGAEVLEMARLERDMRWAGPQRVLGQRSAGEACSRCGLRGDI